MEVMAYEGCGTIAPSRMGMHLTTSKQIDGMNHHLRIFLFEELWRGRKAGIERRYSRPGRVERKETSGGKARGCVTWVIAVGPVVVCT